MFCSAQLQGQPSTSYSQGGELLEPGATSSFYWLFPIALLLEMGVCTSHKRVHGYHHTPVLASVLSFGNVAWTASLHLYDEALSLREWNEASFLSSALLLLAVFHLSGSSDGR